MIHLYLFDIDGVLVDARGYLKALQDTVAHFSRQMGLGDHPPTEEEVRAFEANRLTSEWDSGAACVAALLLERLRWDPSLPEPSHWPDLLSTLAARPHSIPHPDYAALARKVGERFKECEPPSQTTRAVLWNEAQTILGPGTSRAAVAEQGI
jgi:phosphoglycolate phosphatase-like HAD superfamily hydrolase